MKILAVSTCSLDPMLGSGKTRLRWSEGLRALGHSVDVLEPKDYELFPRARRGLRFRQALGATKVVNERLSGGDYDIVEFYGGEFGLITWQLSRRRDRPLLVAHTDGLELLATERESEYSPPPRTLTARLRSVFLAQTHHRLSRAAFDHADVFVTGCELDREYVVRHGIFSTARTAVISPGLDVEYLSRPFAPGSEHSVAYTGSWITRKGIATIVTVMSALLARDRALRFDIYGASNSRELIMTQFPEPVRGRVLVHGRLSNEELAARLSTAKVFFFPTLCEGFGMALAEAMACSCAAVTTPTGYGAELASGSEAVVCDFDDTVAMERELTRLLLDERARHQIALNGWKRVQELSWTANIKRLEAVYLDWTNTHRHRANEGEGAAGSGERYAS